jgi:hypothetical protein
MFDRKRIRRLASSILLALLLWALFLAPRTFSTDGGGGSAPPYPVPTDCDSTSADTTADTISLGFMEQN